MGKKRVGWYCKKGKGFIKTKDSLCGCCYEKSPSMGSREPMYIQTKTPKSQHDETKRFGFMVWFDTMFKKPGGAGILTISEIKEIMRIAYNEGFDLRDRMERLI